ncbi:hypothetical protein I553_5333 [Mycobacterium xenopi 4042]|uniref:Uncharacterized protein n=1 Tax=Mycobacterium xenopi 4042 TaxID=1299334 RepID=X7ZY89_MYCXE|nr:hypothetical protein I553_5333 [Mycobacterium xenopi 4042]
MRQFIGHVDARGNLEGRQSFPAELANSATLGAAEDAGTTAAATVSP